MKYSWNMLEPFTLASLLQVSRKKAFLLAIATAAWVLEIHAQDLSGLTHAEDCISTRIHSDSRTLGHRHYSIPDLSKPVDHPEWLLCPVWAPRFYLVAIEHHRRHRRRLFISCKTDPNIGDTTKAEVAGWLKNTITQSYQHTKFSTQILGAFTAH